MNAVTLAGSLATLLLVVAAILYARAFWKERPGLYPKGFLAAAASLLLFLAEGAWHGLRASHLPFTDFLTATMSLSFMAVACSLWADRGWRMPAVGSVLLPAAALVQIAARILLPELRLMATPEDLHAHGLSLFLVVHVGLVFVGYGSFFASAAAACMYLLLDMDLRKAQDGPVLRGAPSLAASSAAMRRGLRLGVLFMGAGLALGILRALAWPPSDPRLLRDVRIAASSLTWVYFLVLALLERLSVRSRAFLLIAGALLLLFLHAVLAIAPGLHGYAP